MDQIVRLIESPAILIFFGAFVGFVPTWIMSRIQLKQQVMKELLKEKKEAYLEALILQQKIMSFTLFIKKPLDNNEVEKKERLSSEILNEQVLMKAKMQLLYSDEVQILARELISVADPNNESSVQRYNEIYPKLIDKMRKDLGIKE